MCAQNMWGEGMGLHELCYVLLHVLQMALGALKQT